MKSPLQSFLLIALSIFLFTILSCQENSSFDKEPNKSNNVQTETKISSFQEFNNALIDYEIQNNDEENYSEIKYADLPERYKSFYIGENGEHLDYLDNFNQFFSNLNEKESPQYIRAIYESNWSDSEFYNLIYAEELDSAEIKEYQPAFNKYDKQISEFGYWSGLEYDSAATTINYGKYEVGIFRVEETDYWEGILDIYGIMHFDIDFIDKNLTIKVLSRTDELTHKDYHESAGLIKYNYSDHEIILGDSLSVNDAKYHIFLLSEKNTNKGLEENTNTAKIVAVSPISGIIHEQNYNEFINAKNDFLSFPNAPTVTLGDAVIFMYERGKNVNQTIDNWYSFNGKKHYFFSTGTEPHTNQFGCISIINNDSLGIASTECSEIDKLKKIWNYDAPTDKDYYIVTEFDVEKRLVDFVESNSVLHGILGNLDNYIDHNPDKGRYSYYLTVCYGTSEYNCRNETAYFVSTDEGLSWSVSFN